MPIILIKALFPYFSIRWINSNLNYTFLVKFHHNSLIFILFLFASFNLIYLANSFLTEITI